MRPRNRHGDRVDAVPFLVVTGLLGMIALSVGPLYGLAYGYAVAPSLAVSAAVTAGIAVLAYHRLVWTARAERVEVHPQARLERVLYVGIAVGVILAALSLPLLR